MNLTRIHLLSIPFFQPRTEDSLGLNTTESSGGSLDQAIEIGNWEQVVASAKAYFRNNEPMSSSNTVAKAKSLETRGIKVLILLMREPPGCVLE